MAHEPFETPRTEKAKQAIIDDPLMSFQDELDKMAEFTRTLELQLNEARALLTRISDGAEPVLLAEEIKEFLDKTELP
jgi:hypothetical protein